MAAQGFRSVELRRGDTLQRVALRELGDAARWVDIALLNSLRPPYVVDDGADAGDGVAYAGMSILIPVPAASSQKMTSTSSELLKAGRLPTGRH